jgi:23S rRNA (uridine2552-2'-O)-methyltransferase
VSSRRQQRKGEHYYLLAKKTGYRSRASYKLAQLNQRYNLMNVGGVVVDLGAAPGGWLQVAREAVGGDGFVLGVDIQPISSLGFKNVKTLVADITGETTPAAVKDSLPRAADVVLSDASPKISGVWSIDHSRSIELARAAISLAEQVLGPGGNLLVKVFQGELFEDFLREVKRKFDFAKVSKPLASRKGSAEVYLIAKRFKTRVISPV